MLANLLIGLREGLEASLVIGILIAYLVKIDRRDVLPKLWAGVIAAIALSAAIGIVLATGVGQLESPYEEILAGALSFLAAGLVTWMVFWMAKTARNMKAQLQSDVDRNLGGAGWGLMFVAFFAVAREGIETALFIWAAATSSGDTFGGFVGALVGLAIAVSLGFLIYKGMLRLDLKKFFTWSGAFLIVVTAGVVAYGVHEWQEVGLIPGDAFKAFDVTAVIAKDSATAVILQGTVGISPVMSWGQVIAWILYVAITLPLFLRYINKPRKPQATDTSSQNTELVDA